MSSFDLINLMTLIQNLPLNSNVAFYNWLKILPPTTIFWKSSKQACIAKFTTELKFISLDKAS